MDATGISHIALCVRDMDRSLEFYRDILGMRVTADGPTDPTEGGRAHNYAHRRTARRRVSLSYGEGRTTPSLTLTSHPGDEPDGQPILLDQVGISHFSFSVSNVKALAEELISKGVRLAGPLEAYTNPQGEIRSIYVHDPDGILVQFDSGGGSLIGRTRPTP